MKNLDEHFWTERYKQGETGWDAGSITAPLKAYVDQLADKDLKILIPGAGNAHEADYLFNHGFNNVIVVDLSEEPLKNIQQRLPDFPKSNLIQANFFDLDLKVDLVLEQTFFCAIDPSLRKSYAKKMHEIIRPGGKLVGVMFNAPMNADQPPFGGNVEEYRRYFEPYFEVLVMDPCYNSIKPREGKEVFVILKKKA